jgi:hypothetical protein
MIAKRFGFTRDFLKERNTRVVLPTEENSWWIHRSSEGVSPNGLYGLNTPH